MGGRVIGYGIMGMMWASWFLENISSRSAQNSLANTEEPYQVPSHTDSEVMSSANLLPWYFGASHLKKSMDLLKPGRQIVSPTRLKVHTHIVKENQRDSHVFVDRECMFCMWGRGYRTGSNGYELEFMPTLSHADWKHTKTSCSHCSTHPLWYHDQMIQWAMWTLPQA